MDKLIAYLKLDQEEIRKREEICAQLNQIFKQFWPESGKLKEIFVKFSSNFRVP